MNLDQIREKIDAEDKIITAALARRTELSGLVAEYKIANNIPVLDEGREAALLQKIAQDAPEGTEIWLLEIYAEILRVSRARQKSMNGVYGLLGEKLGHSYSPELHRAFGGYDYTLFEKSPAQLEEFLKSAPFDAINVTIPYKKAVIPYCAELSPQAEAIGSVNTLVKLPDGTLRGENTDYHGFKYLLRANNISPAGKKCLVLGDGGVAPTVRAVLRDSGAAEIITVSRRGEDNYDNIDRRADASIIVNTTPLGMYPNNGVSAVDLGLFPALTGVLDLIYNPAKTKLILDAESRGIPCAGGLAMLAAQAARACELFIGRRISDKEVGRIAAATEAKMKNIALIGMPGCGKTTCARKLGELLNREVCDLDEKIEETIGCTIPELFAQKGEAEFRRLETEALAEYSKKSGLIIATGGGVVTCAENLPLLRQNSTVVFLRRADIEALDKSGRPVSQKKSAAEIAAERMPMYLSWSDFIIDCESPAENARRIKEALCL